MDVEVPKSWWLSLKPADSADGRVVYQTSLADTAQRYTVDDYEADKDGKVVRALQVDLPGHRVAPILVYTPGRNALVRSVTKAAAKGLAYGSFVALLRLLSQRGIQNGYGPGPVPGTFRQIEPARQQDHASSAWTVGSSLSFSVAGRTGKGVADAVWKGMRFATKRDKRFRDVLEVFKQPDEGYYDSASHQLVIRGVITKSDLTSYEQTFGS